MPATQRKKPIAPDLLFASRFSARALELDEEYKPLWQYDDSVWYTDPPNWVQLDELALELFD